MQDTQVLQLLEAKSIVNQGGSVCFHYVCPRMKVSLAIFVKSARVSLLITGIIQ